uniref:Ovule protein n=1 Tax=Ascaris lumbricoides TaxID=6252 RepID=A0A0M3I9K0_ASCLU
MRTIHTKCTMLVPMEPSFPILLRLSPSSLHISCSSKMHSFPIKSPQNSSKTL